MTILLRTSWLRLVVLALAAWTTLAIAALAQDIVFKRTDVIVDTTDKVWHRVADGSAGQVDPDYGNWSSEHSWTPPPETIGPRGFSLTLTVSATQKSGGGITAGTGAGGGGFNFDVAEAVAWAVVPVGAPGSDSGSITVNVTPPAGAYAGQEIELRIGGAWGKGVTYRYRAEVAGVGGGDGGNGGNGGSGMGGGGDDEELAAYLDCPPTIVISALPTVTCTIVITDFRRNTADVVEVIFPAMADGWGNHDNGIQVINAEGAEDPYNWDKPRFWPFSVFACPSQNTTGANCYDFVTVPGQVSVPIIVRQAGSPDVDLTLMMAAIGRGDRIIDGRGLPAGSLRFGNRWVAGSFINIENGGVGATPINVGWLSAIWDIFQVEGTEFVRLCNRWKPDECLNTEVGALQSTPIRPEWWSAMWVLEPAEGGYFRIRNRWFEGQYLHMETGALALGPVEPGWRSAMWWGLP